MTEVLYPDDSGTIYNAPDGGVVHFSDYTLVVNALKDLLKGGEHSGPCDNEDEFLGPCWRHVNTSNNREKAAKLVLEQLGEGDYAKSN